MIDVEVSSFLSKTYEESINQKMMYYDYVFPTAAVLEYIDQICELEIPTIIEHILTMPSPSITATDIFQFSSFNDATLRLCTRIREEEDPGLKHPDIGRILLNDGIARKEGAYAKYGENHAKTGEALGLLFELSKTYFLSCIGNVYPDLCEEKRSKLLTRLLLRNRFIERIIGAASNGKINMRQFLYMLSDSTYERRRSNIKTIINELEKSTEYDFSELKDRLDFSFKKQ